MIEPIAEPIWFVIAAWLALVPQDGFVVRGPLGLAQACRQVAHGMTSWLRLMDFALVREMRSAIFDSNFIKIRGKSISLCACTVGRKKKRFSSVGSSSLSETINWLQT